MPVQEGYDLLLPQDRANLGVTIDITRQVNAVNFPSVKDFTTLKIKSLQFSERNCIIVEIEVQFSRIYAIGNNARRPRKELRCKRSIFFILCSAFYSRVRLIDPFRSPCKKRLPSAMISQTLRNCR